MGRTVSVRWPIGNGERFRWYDGVVKQFNVATGEHRIDYSDGDRKW